MVGEVSLLGHLYPGRGGESSAECNPPGERRKRDEERAHMAPERRYDRTLVDWEIAAAAGHPDHRDPDHEVIQNFDPRGLKGASYYVRAGDQRYDAIAGQEGILRAGPKSLQDPSNHGLKGFRIEPGEATVIRSREYLRMPADMFGLLSPRVTWTLRGLMYIGGIIDPGYEGYLFLGISNNSEHPIEIPVESDAGLDLNNEDGLVNMQFVRLSTPATQLSPNPSPDLPAHRQPRPPSGEYAPTKLRESINEHGIRLAAIDEHLTRIQGQMEGIAARLETADKVDERIGKDFDQHRKDFDQYRVKTDSMLRIVEFGFFALFAGVTASLGSSVLQYGSSSSGIARFVFGAIGLSLFAIFVIASRFLPTFGVRHERRK